MQTYTYDGRGNLLTAADASGTITLDYGDPNHPDLATKITYPDGRSLRFAYNSSGRRTQSVDQDEFTTDYLYDGLGRLQKLTDASGNLIVQYTYGLAGELTRKDLGNGTRTTYQYDLAGNLLRLVNLAPDHATVNSQVDYAYDALGRCTSMTTGGVTTNFGYDAGGQLVSMTTPGRTIRYVYDAAGNRVSVDDNGATTAYNANSVNEYTTVGGTTYAYDADGNLISEADATGTTTYTFSDDNRLTAISGPSLSAAYTYDPLGNCNSETVNGQVTRNLFDPFGLGWLAAQYDGSGNLLARYTYGAGLVSQVGPTASAAYYDFDATGNTIGLTGAGGAYVNRYSYLPFGETVTASATLPNFRPPDIALLGYDRLAGLYSQAET
jgi:YD repeat-containing protein